MHNIVYYSIFSYKRYMIDFIVQFVRSISHPAVGNDYVLNIFEMKYVVGNNDHFRTTYNSIKYHKYRKMTNLNLFQASKFY